MAALVCILYSVSVELYRFGCVLIESGVSIDKCLDYLSDKREQILCREYLNNIDRFYWPQQSALCATRGIKCINCRGRAMETITINDDFIEIERGCEAIDCLEDYDQVSVSSSIEAIPNFSSIAFNSIHSIHWSIQKNN